jgi:RND family efflux transporter MFP subunit
MKKVLLLVFVILVCSLSGCFLLPKEEEPLEPPLLKPASVEYVTEKVKLGDIEDKVVITGKFRPENEITLSFDKRGGILLEKNCSLGERVKAGDVLLELDIDDLEFDKDIAYYQYKKAKLIYNQLVSSGASSTQIQIADADKDIAYLNYQRKKVEIEKSQITAPIDGLITYMSKVNIGDNVGARIPLIRLADESQFRLFASGDDAYKFEFGEEVQVEVSINQQKKMFKGKVILTPNEAVEGMENSYEKPTAIIDVRDLNNEDVQMNQNAKITIVKQSAKDVVVIKKSWLNEYVGRTFVYVLENGIKVERDVVTGITTNTDVEIVKGLNVGDKIIVR